MISSPGRRGRRPGGELHFTYAHAIKGFAATLPAPAVRALAANPRIDFIEQDQTVGLGSLQSAPPWGLDRIDQRDLPLSGTYAYLARGTGVYAFIVDTGIRADHVDFGCRVLPGDGYTAIGDGRGTGDCNGHGTHVAGTGSLNRLAYSLVQVGEPATDGGSTGDTGGGETLVSSLSGTSAASGKNWSATATLRGSAGAVTSGRWNYNKASGGCTIPAGADRCSFTLTGIPGRVTSVTYTDAANATLTVTIRKP